MLSSVIRVHQGFSRNKFREGGKLSLSKIEGVRTLIILRSILSLRHNSGGKTIFRGAKYPFAPLEKSLEYTIVRYNFNVLLHVVWYVASYLRTLPKNYLFVILFKQLCSYMG